MWRLLVVLAVLMLITAFTSVDLLANSTSVLQVNEVDTTESSLDHECYNQIPDAPTQIQLSEMETTKIHVNTETQFYKFTSSNSKTTYEFQSKCGPKVGTDNFLATTQYYVNYAYTPTQNSGYCSAKLPKVGVSIKKTMPKFIGKQSFKEQWNNMYYNLEKHENIHAAHGYEAAEQLYSYINNASARTCREIGYSIQTEFQRIMKAAAAKDRELDHSTKHGALAGVHF